jgi:PAS domain S-box-containing protein
MPRVNGLELLKFVRARTPDLPFVIFAGRGSEAVASEAISAGVTDYFPKHTGSQQYECLATRVVDSVARHRAESRTCDRVAPVHDQSGEGARIVGRVTDSAATPEGEAAGTESNRLFRTVFERAFDAILIADDEGEYTDANPAACDLFGVSKEELIGCTPADFAAPGYDVEAAWEGFLRSDRDRGLFPLRRSDGADLLVEFVATPHILPGRHLSVLRDVTELHESRRRVERHRNKLRVLNRVLRHDIRNDANVILGYAELLKDGATDRHEAASAILNRTYDLTRLSDQAREIEALSSEHPATSRIDVVSRSRAVVEQYAADYPHADIRFEGPENAPVSAIGLIESALDNLVENALEHSDRSEPVVRVRISDCTDASSETVSVEVADDGPGIPPSALAVVETGDETPLEHAHGLGLWIVSWIVRESGGSVEFADVSPRGTCVRVVLPRCEDAVGETGRDHDAEGW